jgi:hypothetical protein
MSPVALDITLLLPDPTMRDDDDWVPESDRLWDEIEAAVMGVGEVVGYDHRHEAREVTLLLGGDDADRLLSIVLPLVRAMDPLPGSFYTVRDAERHDDGDPPARVNL